MVRRDDRKQKGFIIRGARDVFVCEVRDESSDYLCSVLKDLRTRTSVINSRTGSASFGSKASELAEDVEWGI